MLETLLRGGFMMVPIILGSVFALAIIIERFWTLQRSRIFPDPFLIRMDEMMKSGRKAEALSACRENESTIARIMTAGLENADRPRAEVHESLQLAGRKETSFLSRWIGALGAIAAMEPLMGLLGTVLGLIEAFKEVEKLKVVGNPSVVASGVWQALITTAAGLMIAIPTYAFYRYFRSKVSGMVMEMEQSAFSMLQQMSRATPDSAQEEDN
ncbi:MAG: MotA/TolQ/ExbB proton channel family protein [Deltaproteobacteria bacterium]|nr:MotA/TolQ/ExbB proton channel family protein [Deltaproteobacteria bacterium]MBW1870910.1 MotA/TolQ/ExbB proton channel family protein [Deltaproteobacteria bacterium]